MATPDKPLVKAVRRDLARENPSTEALLSFFDGDGLGTAIRTSAFTDYEAMERLINIFRHTEKDSDRLKAWAAIISWMREQAELKGLIGRFEQRELTHLENRTVEKTASTKRIVSSLQRNIPNVVSGSQDSFPPDPEDRNSQGSGPKAPSALPDAPPEAVPGGGGQEPDSAPVDV